MAKKLIPANTVFNNWCVIEEVEQRGKNRYFLCKCLNCELVSEVAISVLKRKHTKGCINCNKILEGNRNLIAKKNLVGNKYNRLTVLSFDSRDKRGNYKYLCRCDCGVEKVIYGKELVNGRTQSCGCLRDELVSGENSHRWRGGITDEITLLHNLEAPIRKLSKQRDSFTCQKCGNKGGKLESHHIFDFQHYPELRGNIYNFITLCRSCHQPSKKYPNSFHSIYSAHGTNTLEDLETWLGHKYKYRQSLLNYYEYYY